MLVNESKPLANRGLMLMQKTTPIEHAKTETGVSVTRTETRYFEKEDWFRAALQLFDKIKALPQYEAFRECLSILDGKNHDEQLSRTVLDIVQMSFDQKPLNPSDLLDYFLKSIANAPVPAWVDIDVLGVSIKGTQSFEFSFNGRKFIFRQLDISDFERESHVFAGSEFRLFPPDSILRIQMESWRGIELQEEALKATAILRLFRVCSAKFDRQTFGTKSPFAMIAGTSSHLEKVFVPNHPLVLTIEETKTLENFWRAVDPKLPTELRGFGPNNVTTISIAYERYCDGLLMSHPVERKITFAIMGLEAIYLRENEVQELMYRLELRVCKALSSLQFKNGELRSQIKDGYKIRNSYVHGGHLSDKEKKRIEQKGIPVNDLASKLLDYLRISILHLIISNQTKEQFLDLLEDSFIEQDQNDKLQAIIGSENAILRV